MKNSLRAKKHNKIRRIVVGTSARPRLSVFRSNQFIYAQIIDDSLGKTMLAGTDFKLKGAKKERAYQLGKEIASQALKIKVVEVVFDRGGFLYHGRIAELARGAREGGLKF